MKPAEFSSWSIPEPELLNLLQTTPSGLSKAEAQRRLKLYGANRLQPKKRTDVLVLFFSQFKSPIILILIAAVGLSFFLRDKTDAIIISIIILFSGFLGFKTEAVSSALLCGSGDSSDPVYQPGRNNKSLVLCESEI